MSLVAASTFSSAGTSFSSGSADGTGSSSHYQHAAIFEFGAMMLQNMFGALSFLQCRKDDDFVDRLSYFYTASFLISMAVLVSFKQFGGRPLECWVPAQFTSSWEAYTEMFCWSENTYFIPANEDIPEDIVEREYRQISYYQWVPFFLLIEAFLYYVPCLIWRLMSDKSGIRLNDIVQMATERENIEPEYRTRTIESLSRHIEAALRYQHTATSRTQYTLHRVFKCLNLRYYESYVTGMYLATKIFYVGNVLTNLLLVNKFLETKSYSIYGLGVLRDLLFGRSWTESGNFPRVTLCDFEVRVLGSIQRHSVQCVLVINIFNEKIFILIWIWFCILFFVTTFDALYWFSISMFHRDRFRFVLRHLELTSDPERPALHAGVMYGYCTEITDALWKRYLSQHPENLIDEDSVLINFARTQSIRRNLGGRMGCSASTTSIAHNNHSSGGSGGKRVIRRTSAAAHQRLSRFLSYRQHGTRSEYGDHQSTVPSNRPKLMAGPRAIEQRRLSPQTSGNVSSTIRRISRDNESAAISSDDPQQKSTNLISGAAKTVIHITPSSRPSSRQGAESPRELLIQKEFGRDDSIGTSCDLNASGSKPVKRFSSIKKPLKALRSVVLSSSSNKSNETPPSTPSHQTSVKRSSVLSVPNPNEYIGDVE